MPPANVSGECVWGFIVRMYIECIFQFIEAFSVRFFWWAEQTGLTCGEEDHLDHDHGDDPGPAPAPHDGAR